MDRIAHKQERLRELRRQVARMRRWVVWVLVLEVAALGGLILTRADDGGSAPPPVVVP